MLMIRVSRGSLGRKSITTCIILPLKNNLSLRKRKIGRKVVHCDASATGKLENQPVGVKSELAGFVLAEESLWTGKLHRGTGNIITRDCKENEWYHHRRRLAREARQFLVRRGAVESIDGRSWLERHEAG
jgi:hypothetical protein